MTRLDLIESNVEEVLRSQSPHQFGNRQTIKQVKIDGVRLDKDININLGTGAANCDPDIFSNQTNLICNARMTSGT